MKTASDLPFLQNVGIMTRLESPVGFIQIGQKIKTQVIANLDLPQEAINESIAAISPYGDTWHIGGMVGINTYYHAIKFSSPLWNAYWTSLIGVKPLPEKYAFIGDVPNKFGLKPFEGVCWDIFFKEWAATGVDGRMTGHSHAPYAILKTDPEYQKLIPCIDPKRSSLALVEEIHRLAGFTSKPFKLTNEEEFEEFKQALFKRIKK